MRTTIIRYIYSTFFYLFLPLVLLRLLWRSRRNSAYRRRIAERFGFISKLSADTPSIWIHAVSVGESLVAVSIIKKLRLQYPTTPIIVTTLTPTGAGSIQAGLGDSVSHVYIPYDLPDAVHRFLRRLNPKIAIIVETELWPNLLAACRVRHLPVVIANGRLSAKSAAGYKRIAPLTKQMLDSISLLLAQGKADAERFIALGMNPEHVVVTGNIKFDLELPSDLMARSEVLRMHLLKDCSAVDRLLWVAASTHDGEEEIILKAHQFIREKYPHALLILVARHPERFTQVAELAIQYGFSVIRRSQNTSCDKDTAVYVGDTMGELLLFYAAADVAFVGGSFTPVGGHNLLEPAALSKPVITGPHLFNFADISELLHQADALVKVKEGSSLAEAVLRFFADADLRKCQGERAKQVVEANRGALAKHIDLIAEYL